MVKLPGVLSQSFRWTLSWGWGSFRLFQRAACLHVAIPALVEDLLILRHQLRAARKGHLPLSRTTDLERTKVGGWVWMESLEWLKILVLNFFNRCFRGFPSQGCKFEGGEVSLCCTKKGPENCKNQVKLHPPLRRALKHSMIDVIRNLKISSLKFSEKKGSFCGLREILQQMSASEQNNALGLWNLATPCATTPYPR